MTIIKKLQGIQDIDPHQDLWMFAYGSLMWWQNFTFAEKRPATLTGFHRDFCILSVVYRGTPQQPGLALGLKPGGYCHGMAFRLSQSHLSTELAAIWSREVMTNTYSPSIVECTLHEPDTPIQGLAFIANPNGVKYIELSTRQKVAHILSGVGQSGSCYDYLTNTIGYLAELNIKDKQLEDCYHAVNASKTIAPVKSEIT